jgi:glyoxylase-like metal-dependent hydrolase (beta-lactamase superfamily II)
MKAMIEKVSDSIYRIVVPLPIPVGSMNSYIVAERDRNLIVDPGMAHSQCMEVMQAAIDELAIDLHATDYFITHHHVDHFSLVSRLMAAGSTIYIHRAEAAEIERIASGAFLSDFAGFLETIGFPEKDPEKVMPFGEGDGYRTGYPWPFHYVEDGEMKDLGGRSFQCIVTPGHSVGHTCLYEPAQKILLSGDQVSPVLQYLSDRDSPLEAHLNSLDRLYRLDVELMLPGHGAPFRDLKKRIKQLETHHQERAEDVLSVLADGGLDAYQVAMRVRRDKTAAKGWESLPLVQKFFFARDCLVHLQYMERKGRVHSEISRQRIVFTPQ